MLFFQADLLAIRGKSEIVRSQMAPPRPPVEGPLLGSGHRRV